METTKTESRKIQLVGKRSYAISLPKEWIVENNLKEQEIVYLNVTKNNDLLIQGKSKGIKIKESLTVEVESIPNIIEFLIFCYGKSINKLKLLSKKFDSNRIKKIREILNYLDGYEITNENENTIEISFLYTEVNITVKTIISRIVYLLKIMVESMENKDETILNQTELSIDRLYYLSTKILFDCLRSQNYRTINEIESQEDIFHYKDIIKRLENIGDIIYTFKNTEFNKTEMTKIRQGVALCEQILIKKGEQEEYNRILEKIPEKNITETKYAIQRIYHLCRDIIENMSAIEYNKKYFSKET